MRLASAPGDRTAHLLDKLKLDLSLTPEEVERVRTGVEAEFAVLRSAGPPGAPSSQEDMREQARMRVAKVLRTVLNPVQYRKYEELQRARPTGSKTGTVWTYEGGALVPHQVRFGLADADVTEITDGLKEGALVVLRAREIAP